MKVIQLLGWHSLSCVLVNDFDADGCPTLGLQIVSRQVLGRKVADAPAVGCLPTQVAPWIQAPQAPAHHHSALLVNIN